MHINRLPICLALIALAAQISPCLVMGAANHQPNVSKILELNDSTVNDTLARYPFFILDCHEPGCDPCQRMNATLSELSIELSGQATFGKINADENNRIAERYKVTAYPTLLIFKNGTFVEKDVGYGSKARIVDRLHRLMPGLNTSLVKPDSDLAPTAQAPPGQGANRSA